MRVFVAGATGAIGKQLVPRLVAAGHEVVGMTSKESNRGLVGELGATPVVADGLDPDQVAEAVGRANPEVIVHQLTTIGSLDMRHFDRDFALTNRLRTEGTDHLLSAGRAVGVRRFVAQSAVYGFYARTGGAVKSEDDPLDPSPPRESARARPRSGISRRRCWVPSGRRGSCSATAPSTAGHVAVSWRRAVELVRKRKFPLVGDGGGVWSFVHIADAAEATVAAVEHGSRGIYNVVDDDPAPVAQWLPALATSSEPRGRCACLGSSGGCSPGRPGRVVADIRGAWNAKAKPSWRGARRTRAGVRGSSGMTDRERLLDELRPVAFAIAYRMLGSVSEAEDVVQEALLRVHQSLDAGEQIESPRAFVATVTTRLAINECAPRVPVASAMSASGCRSRSSPTATDDPARHAETADSLSLACWCCWRVSRLSSEPCCCFTMCSATGIRRSRRSSAKARTTCASSPPAPDATSSSAGPASKRRASSATNWHDGSSRPPSKAISPGSRRCSLTTWS